MKERTDGTGGIYRDSGGGWRAQIRYFDAFQNKSVTVRRRAKNRDDARAKLRELQAGAIVEQKPAASMRVVDYLTQYEANTLPTLGLTPATLAVHHNLIRNPLTPTLSEITLQEFDAVRARRWLGRLQASTTTPRGGKATTRPLSTTTQRKAFYCLAKALDVAVRDGLIASNAVRDLTPPREAHTVVPSTSAADFDERIMPAIQGHRIAPLVTFIGLTGCRLGEALGLRWTDVDLTKNTATLRRSGSTTDRTKTGRIRTVPLVPEVVASLKARRQEQREDRLRMGSGWQDEQLLIFTTTVGTPIDPNNAWRDFRRILSANDLQTDRPFHSLRHGLATRLLRREVPMHVVSAILGHASVRMTIDKYGHIEPVMHAEELAAALAKR